MSHIAKINIEIRDLDSLDRACKALGLELVRGQKTYHWYGTSVGDYPLPEGFTKEDLGKCDHAIRIPGAKTTGFDAPYEIGVVKRRDGRPGYELLWDFWAGGYGMEAKVGAGAKKLAQQYTTQLTVQHWQRKGYRVTTTTKEDGRIIISATR